ncbi:hypothetical protein THAOC_09106 [Thalassiosira oceanica]|uniref:Uncharacterized protein n=1 Tax=Thalassiosira oceanica TaxID=159749 RepID=K0ST94_THAOC|nr:hypothetical protein THAOC_09106 [Thalassiosira oceanica]|eukprot:EJK69618.1 hypothetical protein THAOC_09106 [Thalassiosira oceanica]
MGGSIGSSQSVASVDLKQPSIDAAASSVVDLPALMTANVSRAAGVVGNQISPNQGDMTDSSRQAPSQEESSPRFGNIRFLATVATGFNNLGGRSVDLLAIVLVRCGGRSRDCDCNRTGHAGKSSPPGKKECHGHSYRFILAKQVCQAYLLKTKKLDDKFAPEIVGDGTGNVVGPFQTMLGRFYRGQVLPVCAGWFEEINIDFDKIIRQLARKAAAGDHGPSHLATRQQRPQRRRISNHAPPIQTSDRSRNRARERTTQAKQATLRQGHPRGGRGRLQRQSQQQ